MSPPISSHTEIVMLPVLSATLQDLTSWPSLVLVTRPVKIYKNQKEEGGKDELDNEAVQGSCLTLLGHVTGLASVPG